ncbi:MAG: type II toxin-antitoxin system RelE/ParE family toxin [Magnetococcales bacterium]|nr:type II toxin-antitoxin system RelE/ParE family toxin [Magnetococcales bacterium]
MALQVSLIAQRDLAGIRRFIAQDQPQNADAWIVRLLATCKRLALFPDLGQPVAFIARPVFCFPVGRYLVIYRKWEDGRGVVILRVLHSAQNIQRILGGLSDES